MARSQRLLALSLLFTLACKGGCGKQGVTSDDHPTAPPDSPDFATSSTEEFTALVGRPQGDADREPQIAITFSRPVVTLESLDDGARRVAPATITPAVAGTWRWLGSASVEFVPRDKLPLATTFEIEVKPGLKAWDGATLKQGFKFSFSTPRPRVWSIKPQAGHRWLKADTTFEVTFNQPIGNLADKASLIVGGKRVALQLTDTKKFTPPEDGGYYLPEFGYDATATVYTLKPTQPLALDQVVSFTIDKSVTPTAGPLGLVGDFKAEFHTYGKPAYLNARACLGAEECPFGPLVLSVANAIDIGTLKDKLKITPEVSVDWERAGSFEPRHDDYTGLKDAYVVLPGKYFPGTKYEITIAAGAKDVFGQELGTFSGKAGLSSLRPSFEPGQRLALLEDKGDGALPLESVNLHKLEAKLYKLTPATLAPLLFDYRVQGRPGTPQNLVIDVSGKANRPRTQPFDVRGPLQGARLFVVDFLAPELKEKYQRTRTVVGQITDLAVHAKLGATGGLVWVTRLSTGEVVADADITTYDEFGKAHFSGKTNADGIARLPALSELTSVPKDESWRGPRVLVAAQKDGDQGVTMSDGDQRFLPPRIGHRGVFEPYETASLGTLFAERGIYRPGDTVYVKGLIRGLRLGRLEKPAAGATVTIEAQDDEGNALMKTTAQVSKFGTYQASLKIEKSARLGYYGLHAKTALAGRMLESTGYFRVEEYRPPQFVVDVLGDKNLWSGAALQATVNARYLFGGAMARAHALWTVERTNATYTPPKNDDFSFGESVSGYDEEGHYEATTVTSRGEGELDDKGQLKLDAGKADTPGDKPYRYTIEAEVTDVNRQRVANRTEVFVHPAKIYVGQRLKGSTFVDAGKPVELELVASNFEGDRQGGVLITTELKRREWKNIRKKGFGDEWSMVSEPVDESIGKCEAKSAADPVSCKLAVEKPGYYLLVSSAADADGRKSSSITTFYATGDGWFAWGRDDTERIDLVPDRAVYKPGDTAKILVKSPYKEAEAILTTEREGVLTSKRVKLTGAATALDLPIGEEHVPNLFVSVMLVRGRVPTDKGIETGEDPGRPAVRVGYTELKIEKAVKRLAVSVTPDGKDKRPRDKVKVAVDIKGSDGGPADGEVTLWAVDEGVLRLTAYQPPDPVDALYPPRGLHVAVSEPLFNLVLRKLYLEKGQTPGGGGGVSEGNGVRSNFKTTAHFVGDVVSKNGHAEVEFTLPDNLTTFRIMAFVVGDDDRFGLGDSNVTVSKPLLAMPALPRLIRLGDRVEAGVVVHRHGTEINSATVSLEADGAQVEGDTKKNITFTSDRPVEVRFVLKAPAPGDAKLRFTVTGSGLEDRVEQTIPMKLTVPMETVALYGDTSSEKQEGLTPPNDTVPGVGGLELTLAATALASYPEAMQQLLEYPYGCVEQQSSRLVPLVALKTLSGQFKDTQAFSDTAVKWLGKDTFSGGSVNDVIHDTIRSLQAKQNADGGYSFWDANGCSSSEGSSFAVLALSQASKAGFQVDRAALNRGQTFIANVAAGQKGPCEYGAPSPTTQVFALYTLARAGAAKSSLEPDLFDLRDKLGLEGKVMLADAMAISGARKAQMKQLLDEVLRNAKESPSEVHLEDATYGDFGSNTRASAIYLQALLDSSPEHPFVAKVIRYLSEIRVKGRFRTTQEAAFALSAMTDVVRLKEKATPNYTATVSLGGKALVSHAFAGRSFEVLRQKLTSEVWSGLSGATKLTFKKDGEGTLYYSATMRYALKTPRTTAIDQGLTVQRWFEPFERKGQATQFIAGDLVRLNVRVASRQARRYVAIDVPVPSGFELLDTSLKTQARMPVAAEGDEPSRSQWEEGFYSPFNHTERRDDRVAIFSDELPAGVHSLKFALRATTPGDFELPAAHAEEMYHPEVFGTSEPGRVRVLVSGEVAAK